MGLPWWLRGLSFCLHCGRPGFDPWVGKIPWWRQWHPTPVFLPGKSHGWRSLVGYSPWGCKASDMTEQLHFTSLQRTFWTFLVAKWMGIHLPMQGTWVRSLVQEDPPGSRKILLGVPQLLNLNFRAHVLQLPKPTHLRHAPKQWETCTTAREEPPITAVEKVKSESVCQWDSCDLKDCSLRGSSVHGILQARILKWVAISFSRGSSWSRDGTQVSRTAGRFFTVWATREALEMAGGKQWRPNTAKKKEQFKEEGDLKDALRGGKGDWLGAERRQKGFGKGKLRTKGEARAHPEAGWGGEVAGSQAAELGKMGWTYSARSAF